MGALWQFLILMCFSAGLGGAIASAQRGRYGPGGYTLAVAVGLAVGVCCGWVMYVTHDPIGRKILNRFPSEASAKLEWWFFVFYVAKVLWLIVSTVLGFWLSSMLLRLVFGGPF